MTALDLARMQFGITTIFHFFFVPVSIGLAFYVAICQTRHYRTGKEFYARQVKFFGQALPDLVRRRRGDRVIQEFQFGMNWSQYSRFVGDIFGAPLAMEGLAAFFLESTFIGLWIFGKGRLSAARAPGDDLARLVRVGAVGVVHHRGQLVDAASRRLRDGRRQAAS